jgi:hypothetical protein
MFEEEEEVAVEFVEVEAVKVAEAVLFLSLINRVSRLSLISIFF